MARIEALLAETPDDPELHYALAMEHSSAGDDAGCVTVLRDMIARFAAAPFIPAYLQAGQALARLDRTDEAATVLRDGIAAADRVGTADAMHARGEMLGLLATVE
ncbi:hypothetical protein [Urbifossiella limnaea]|nr:hypothetical protein [Urbifossiella limnaea]